MIDDPAILGEACAYFNKKAPVLFFVLSAAGEIVAANQYAEKVAGHNLKGESIQDQFVDFTGKFDLASLLQDPSGEHLLHIRTHSGSPQSFYFSFLKLDAHVLIFGRQDTEEIEAMRKEVLSLNQELNNLMRQLHKKNAQLQRLNAEKNQFLGMAAHDLRQPIGLILNYSEFLIEEIADNLSTDHRDYYLKTINASGAFMKRLVDDFLDVSAIEAGKFDLDLQPVKIADVLDQSLKLNHLQAVKKGIVLTVLFPETMPRVIIDASKIEQAVTNLVSNAIQHSEPGMAVTIALACDPHRFTISVRDRGSGILPEEMEKLFMPFEKTRSRKTAGEKSTGLGMLITRKIIEAHGGEIQVSSVLGEGTAVNFTLPLNGALTLGKKT